MFIIYFNNMTQLYSNLVYYASNNTYLCLVLVVLGSPQVSRVRLALLHTPSLKHEHDHPPFSCTHTCTA